MANAEHRAELERGVASWNAWRDRSGQRPVDLSGLSLERAPLHGCNLLRADLRGANLRGAQLPYAHLKDADLTGAVIERANFEHVNARRATFDGVVGGEARFIAATLRRASFRGADLRGATFYRAYLKNVRLDGAVLVGARLAKAYLERASCVRADLTDVDLRGASLVQTNLDEATLCGARVYGVAAWGTSLVGARQDDMVLSRTDDEPRMYVDDLGSAHLVSLMCENSGLRAFLDSVSSRFVLVLGRFSDERKRVLDQLRDALRTKGYVAVLFDFERPLNRAFIEVIKTLAGLSRFVVADLTDPRVVHQELDTILTEYPSVPVRPVLAEGHPTPTTLRDHAQRRALVLPLFRYRDAAHLVASIEEHVVRPAEARAQELEDLLSDFMRDAFSAPDAVAPDDV